MNNYNVCDYVTHKALHGPWISAAVVQWINSGSNPKLFCNMSLYMTMRKPLPHPITTLLIPGEAL